jgi:L-threonylcarbamoyladenylate synthase
MEKKILPCLARKTQVKIPPTFNQPLGKMRVPKKIIEILKKGGVGILPTDTIYGIVGSALKKETVERIFKIKKRRNKKPFIVLISDLKDLKIFGIKIKPFQKSLIKKFWPGPVSLIFDCPSKKFEYLHLGKKSLALRMPKPKWLRALLRRTGPLVAPSANFSGEKPVESIKKAKEIFGEKVDFYLSGKVQKRPSTLIDVRKKEIKVLRK